MKKLLFGFLFLTSCVQTGGSGVGGETITYVTYPIPATATVTANAASIDWSDGDLQVVDLQGSTGDVTVTMSNPHTGATALKIIQGDNGDTIIWSPVALWSEGTIPTITAANDSVDLASFVWDGSSYLGSITQDLQ